MFNSLWSSKTYFYKTVEAANNQMKQENKSGHVIDCYKAAERSGFEKNAISCEIFRLSKLVNEISRAPVL